MDEAVEAMMARPYVDDPECWKKLAAAIIEQAAWDYRWVREAGGLGTLRARLKPHRANGRASKLIDAESAVRFFKTKAFEQLCLFVGVGAEGIRDRLQQEGPVE